LQDRRMGLYQTCVRIWYNSISLFNIRIEHN
jgi:hypothetical protein